MTDDISLRRYTPGDAGTWNAFVAGSKNGTFLHDRGFMDYHADRFDDHSLIFEEAGKPVALLPAHRAGARLVSHGGLTYGGLISGPAMTAERMCALVAHLVEELPTLGFEGLDYKPVPHLFHRQPSEEDLYALFQNGARPGRFDLSFAVPLQRRLPFSTLRKRGAKKAIKAGVAVQESTDFAGFWSVLQQTLEDRHGTAPVHSLAEIQRLAEGFAGQIRLFLAMQGDDILAGTVIFDHGAAIHCQYIATSPDGRQVGALDLLMQHLIETTFCDRDWFSFGASTTDGGTVLNVGLSRQKEMFGARSIVLPHYTLDMT